jgi:serine protease AprX
MDTPTRLPIKLVHSRQEDFIPPEAGGSPRKLFGDVTPETRAQLVGQVQGLRQTFAVDFKRWPNLPAVARVRLKEEALAKSHRPRGLLNPSTTPIIGAEGFGELLVSVQPSGLDQLAREIETDTTRGRTADISTIQAITAYRIDSSVSDLDALRKRVAEGEATLKLRLFDHRNTALNAILYDAFLKQIADLKLTPPEELPYGGGIRVFRLRGVRPDAVVALAGFVGTQHLSSFPRYVSIRAASVQVRQLSNADFPAPEAGRHYPTVGIIDSGTSPADPFLAPWVSARHVYVAPSEQTFDHGSFVAGLIVHPRLLNAKQPAFPDASSKVVDVVAIPGGGAGLGEDELVTILEEVLPKHPEVRVWNLSLAGHAPCSDGDFSDLAVKLDDLQDRFGVTFVFAAGNYTTKPFRSWPPEDLGEADRICGPADSVRGITVASTAHLAHATSQVQKNEPSPFSRRGPGPVYIPKPEVSHFGGNCDKTGNYAQTGVLSVDGNGHIAENIGTSFASPLVATLLAGIDSALASTPSRNLAKALLVHSAVLSSKELSAHDIRYRGFGVPGSVLDVVTCVPWSATLIFEPDLLSGLEFIRPNFPIPPSLRTAAGKVRGDFAMTLVYDPPLDAAYGSEYCRINVDASLGTYEKGPDGKRHHHRQIPPEPKDISKLYERQLIEHGFKWSPVKVYRRSMKGVSGKLWRLKIDLLNRSGFSTATPQGAAVIITMSDPQQKANVYDEVVTLMQKAGWATNDLQVQTRVRT